MKMYVPVLNEKIKIIFKFVRMQSTGAGGRLSATMHLPSSLVTCVPYPEPTRREENRLLQVVFDYNTRTLACLSPFRPHVHAHNK